MSPAQALDGETYVPFMGIRGRNGYDDPFMVSEDQCCEALNVDWYGAAVGRRRWGASAIGLTGGTAFTNQIFFMGRNVPGYSQAAAEMFAADGANPALLKRLTGGVAWADVTMPDSIDSLIAANREMVGVPFNGKYFVCYSHAGVNRLHVVDPLGNGRRVGLGVGVVPTVADQGVGVYPNTPRFYKMRWVTQVAGVTVRAGELGPATASFSPSGGGLSARVGKPAALGESETHWQVYVSPNDANYQLLATVLIATTFYDDTANPTTYVGTAAPLSGFHLPPPSARFIVAGSGRLIMGGAYETSGGEVPPSPRNLWWTASPGGDVGDDERIIISTTINNFATLDSAVTGISEPIVNPGTLAETFLAFTYDGMYRFTETGNVNSAYTQVKIAGGQGCISHRTIVVAHDDAGYPTTYWLSRRGPERAGLQGNQFCGVDIQDLWDRINLDAVFIPHGVYHADIHQIWWYIPVDGATAPNLKIVFDTWLGRIVDVFRLGAVRGGWSQHNGESAKAVCSVMFSDTIGASMGRKLKPYISYQPSQAIWKCDAVDTFDDAGTGYQAYVESKPLAPWGLGRMGGITQEPHIIYTAKALTTTQVTVTVIINEGASDESAPRTSPVSYTFPGPAGTIARATLPLSANLCSRAFMIRVRVGDSAVGAFNQWKVSAVILPVQAEGYQ